MPSTLCGTAAGWSWEVVLMRPRRMNPVPSAVMNEGTRTVTVKKPLTKPVTSPTSGRPDPDLPRPARTGPHVLVVAIGLLIAPDGRGRYAWAEAPPWNLLFFVNWATLPGFSTVRPVSVFGGASCPPDRLYRYR